MDIGTVSTVWIDPPPDAVDEYWWNLWYNAKHGPERFRLDGVFAWRRFEIVPGVPAGPDLPDEHKYFTLSDQRDNSVLLSDAAKELIASNIAESKEPNTGEALHVEGAQWVSASYELECSLHEDYDPPFTDYLLVIGHDLPDEQQPSFDAWVRDEFLARLSEVPGHVASRHFRPAPGYPHPRLTHQSDHTAPQCLTLCDFETIEAMESVQFAELGEPSGAKLVKCQLYKLFYPYVGFKHVSTLG